MLAQIRSHAKQRGFTLLELMIAVAILGILASTAVTAFTRYQWRSKRSEAYANLESIRKVELAYRTEFGAFVGALPSPAVTTISGNKQNWRGSGSFTAATDATHPGFGVLGWQPEGAVYYDYSVEALPDTGAGPSFTAGAFGDVDNDGGTAALLYVHPDNGGGSPECTFCAGVLFAHSGPPLDASAQPILNTVAPVTTNADDF